jgi:hypothetical protein
MKNLLFLILLLPFCGFGQAIFPYFEKITDEDLQMSIYHKDTSAAAIYLMNYGKARYDEIKKKPCFYYDHHYQIKILNKSAFDEADVTLYFFKKRPIENLKAVIHFFENGEHKSTPVTEFFTEEISKYIHAYKFSFPNVKEGTVIEYCYTTIGNAIALPNDFYFQKKHPVKHGEYHFIFSSKEDYQMLNPDLKFNEFDYRKFPMTKQLKTTRELTEYWWKAFDIPGLPDEPFVYNLMDYRHRIRLQITQFNENNKTGPNKYKHEWISLAVDFESVLDRIYEYYRPTPTIHKIIKPLKEQITASTSDLDKLKILYDYTQNTVEWNEEYARFLTRTIEDTYKEKEGTSADINLFLFRLLKHYGMEVHPIIVSSRKNGRIHKEYPFIEQFDHLILQVKVFDKYLIIDASDKTYPYDLLPEKSLSEEGFLMNKNKSTFILLTMDKAEHQQLVEATITPSGSIQGKMRTIYTNYAAHDIRKVYEEIGLEKYKTNYFKASSDFQIFSLEMKNLEDKNQELVENIDFEINDVTQSTGNLIYCNSLLGIDAIDHPFTAQNRHLPIEIPYPSLKKNIIKITIPENYSVESLPEEVQIDLPQSGGQYTFNVTQKDNIIAITSTLYVKRLHFSVAEYKEIQDFFNKIVVAESSQIVLKKD